MLLVEKECLGEEQNEDGTHAVVAETLCRAGGEDKVNLSGVVMYSLNMLLLFWLLLDVEGTKLVIILRKLMGIIRNLPTSLRELADKLVQTYP